MVVHIPQFCDVIYRAKRKLSHYAIKDSLLLNLILLLFCSLERFMGLKYSARVFRRFYLMSEWTLTSKFRSDWQLVRGHGVSQVLTKKRSRAELLHLRLLYIMGLQPERKKLTMQTINWTVLSAIQMNHLC